VIGLILFAGAAIAFATGIVSGRYLGILGVVVPAAITVALGSAWEWDPEAMFIVIAAGVISSVGFLFGWARRRRWRRARRLSSAA
jgi:nitrate reductase gamma subunit